MSGEASEQKRRQGHYPSGSAAGMSTEMGSTTLPEVQPNSSKAAGYATHQAHGDSNVPRFGGAVNSKQRLATGNDKESRMRANNALAPIVNNPGAPGTAQADARNKSLN